MFSENSSCLLWQRGSCSTAQRPVELSENILQNLFNKLQTQTAERRCNTNLSIHNGFVWISRPIFLGDEGGIHGISPPRNRYSAVQRHCSVLVQYQAQRPLRHGNASRRLPRAPWFQVGGQQVGARGRQYLSQEVHRRHQHLIVPSQAQVKTRNSRDNKTILGIFVKRVAWTRPAVWGGHDAETCNRSYQY